MAIILGENMGEQFAERLRERLTCLGLSQKDFAGQLGVTEATVSRYLKGERRPSLNVINKIAKILNTTPDYLFDAEAANTSDALTNIKLMIAHNAKDMTIDDKMELIRMLMENK